MNKIWKANTAEYASYWRKNGTKSNVYLWKHYLDTVKLSTLIVQKIYVQHQGYFKASADVMYALK